MTAPVITIRTPRLVLRPPTDDDAPALAAFFSDPLNFPWPAEQDLTAAIMSARIARWTAAAAAGKNAFLVITESHPADPTDPTAAANRILGFSGFNNLPYAPPLGSQPVWTMPRLTRDDPRAVAVADVGVSIDRRFQRLGYAKETLCAVVEYAFGVLRCAWVHLDTAKNNEPFRAVMRSMGVPEVEGSEEDPLAPVENAAFWLARKSWNFDFDAATWGGIREDMMRKGKWPL
ncbi:acyl-CoA N-acyltransferase [Zopfochytrium polystomum]|nr:acyl-CoA N-acyltransferase [Zopfochytrium polystomum]